MQTTEKPDYLEPLYSFRKLYSFIFQMHVILNKLKFTYNLPELFEKTDC